MTPRAFLAIGVATSAILVSACDSSGGGPDLDATPVAPANGSITVQASEWKFEPSVIELAEGEEIEITFENQGEVTHNLKVDDLDADVIESSEDGELFVEADEGDSAKLVFTPTEAGSFTYYCDIPDHRDLGMEGRLVVSGG